MAKFSFFEGKNKLSSKQIFIERAKYEIGVFDDYEIPKPLKKLYFGELQFYGKVNDSLDPVVINEKKLKLISTKENYFVLDFVKDQFDALRQNFLQNMTINSISKDESFLSYIKVYKGYTSHEQEYQSYIKSILTTFNKNYIYDSNRINNVYDFSSYIQYLIEFSKLSSKTLPLTKTSFLKTNFCPISVSGLAIDIANLKYSEDAPKLTNFYNSSNYEFYKNACIKHGFFIDYNAPWRLVADLGSPAMVNAISKNGYDRQTIFTTHYTTTADSEIDNIKNIMFGGYAALVRNFPITKIPKDCNGRLVSEIITRPQITLKNVNQIIDDNLALKIYIDIRCSEQEQEITQSLKNIMYSNSLSILKSSGISSAINYVEQQLKPKQLLGSGTINTRVLNLRVFNQEG